MLTSESFLENGFPLRVRAHSRRSGVRSLEQTTASAIEAPLKMRKVGGVGAPKCPHANAIVQSHINSHSVPVEGWMGIWGIRY